MTLTTTLQDTTGTTDDWRIATADLRDLLTASASANDEAGNLPPDTFDALRRTGLTAALVPTEFGGGGATYREMCTALQELGASDPSVAVTLAMHTHLVAFQVWRQNHGMDASPMFAKVVGGAMLVSTGASDWVSSSGTATKVDGGYIVSARKSPASGAEVGNILVTSIRWDDAPDGPQVLHCAVPFTADGVSIEMTWDTMGLRATGSHTVVLQDVFVPDAAVSLTRPADVWHPVWNTIMGAAMPLIMAAYLGLTDAAVAEALRMVDGRLDAHVTQLAGEMINAHVTATDLVDAMVASADDLRFDNTDAHASVTLSRKTVAADAMIDTVRLAIELTGGRGFNRSSSLERLYRDVHGVLFHPLPRAKQTTLTGRVALGATPIG